MKPILQGRETSELLEEFQPCFMPCVDSSSHMLLTKYWGETEAQLLTEECFSCGIASNRVNPAKHNNDHYMIDSMILSSAIIAEAQNNFYNEGFPGPPSQAFVVRSLYRLIIRSSKHNGLQSFFSPMPQLC